MMPPICFITHERLAPGESCLISFAATPESEDWHRRANATPGFTGHPPEQAWLHKQFEADARELKHLPLNLALQEIRRRHGMG